MLQLKVPPQCNWPDRIQCKQSSLAPHTDFSSGYFNLHNTQCPARYSQDKSLGNFTSNNLNNNFTAPGTRFYLVQSLQLLFFHCQKNSRPHYISFKSTASGPYLLSLSSIARSNNSPVWPRSRTHQDHAYALQTRTMANELKISGDVQDNGWTSTDYSQTEWRLF